MTSNSLDVFAVYIYQLVSGCVKKYGETSKGRLAREEFGAFRRGPISLPIILPFPMLSGANFMLSHNSLPVWRRDKGLCVCVVISSH